MTTQFNTDTSVIFNEPPRSQYDLHFRVLGIPVRVHPFFWFATILLGLSANEQPLNMLIWVGACFVSILVHELGHALTARGFGWQPWITLHGFGGLASYRPTYRSPRNQVLVTAAGPGIGFAFAALILAMIKATGHEVQISGHFRTLLPIAYEGYRSPQLNLLINDLLFINIFWGLINLLPVYPLDGGQIARELLGLASPHDGMRQSLWLSLVAAVVMAALALVKLDDKYIAIFFGYLAYLSYATLTANFGRGGGLGGFR